MSGLGMKDQSALTPDIEIRVAADFTPEQRNETLSILELLDEELGGGNYRVLRCVLFLARGDLARLVHFADRARSDWRDVIYWAEYDDQDRQVRDFNQPFR
jgi:hypothetical protein